MRIGQLARLCNVSTDTLRYYEREGLLKPARRGNGYRDYETSDTHVVNFVRGAQALGFSLAEIGRAVPRLRSGDVGRAEVERWLKGKATAIDAELKRMFELRRAVRVALADLDACVPDQRATVDSATGRASGHGACMPRERLMRHRRGRR